MIRRGSFVRSSRRIDELVARHATLAQRLALLRAADLAVDESDEGDRGIAVMHGVDLGASAEHLGQPIWVAPMRREPHQGAVFFVNLFFVGSEDGVVVRVQQALQETRPRLGGKARAPRGGKARGGDLADAVKKLTR